MRYILCFGKKVPNTKNFLTKKSNLLFLVHKFGDYQFENYFVKLT